MRTCTPKLGYENTPFGYQTHCLICAKELNFKGAAWNHYCHSDISNVEIVTARKKSTIQERLLKECDVRHDIEAVVIKARIQFAGDICAVEAKYHWTCMQRFMFGKPVAFNPDSRNANTLNWDTLNDEAFIELCKWLTNTDHSHDTTHWMIFKNSSQHTSPSAWIIVRCRARHEWNRWEYQTGRFGGLAK